MNARVDDDGRLTSLDILRGLALLGMVIVHFHMRLRRDVGGPEDLIPWGVWMLLEQKAWGTFAFLFGAGFALFLRRLEARGEPVLAPFLRRMAALFGFGIVAGVGFGFHILTQYACWGLVLLLLRRWSTRALLVTAVVAAMTQPVVAEVRAWIAHSSGVPMSPRPGLAEIRAAEAAVEGGSYLTLLAARWREFLATSPGGWRGLLPDSNLTLFLLGLLALRHGILDDPLRHRKLITGWIAFGALSWLAYWLALKRLEEWGPPGVGWPLATGLGLLQDQWLCLAYVGTTLLVLAARPALQRTLAPVANAGRMALTNYILQAIVIDGLASGYGFALKLRPFVYLPAAILLFALLAALSTAWLARFRYGPLEWLWRSATFARWQPLRRARPVPAAATPVAAR